MAKLQTKSNNINPFGGLFPIFKTLDKSGVRNVIDRTLDPRGTLLAFSHGDLRRVSVFLLPSFAFSRLFAKVDLPLPFEPRSQALLAVVSLLSAFHPSRFGLFLRRVSAFLLPSFAFSRLFAKVDLPLPFEPRSQTILAVVSLLCAFHPSRFGPVLRRLKRFSLPSFANCGVFAKVCILCWVAEHYISVSDNKVQYQLSINFR